MKLGKCGLFALLVTAIATLTACNRAPADSEAGAAEGGAKVGVVVKTLSNPVWQGVQKGVEDEAKNLNINVEVTGGQNENDVDGQIAKVQSFVTQGVSAILISPSGAQLTPALQRAVDRGIKVVIIDSDIPLNGKSSFVQSDQADGARKVTQVLLDSLGAGAQGKKAGMLDYPGATSVIDRIDAAKPMLEAAGMQIIGPLPGKCDRATALNATQGMLQAHPDLAGIFGACGYNATGAAQAVSDARKSIPVIGFDGLTGEIQAVKEGKILATVWQDFAAIGATSLDAAINATQGKPVEPAITVPAQIVTKDNVAQYEGRGY